ncbi:hypothetical protein [Occallatibacter savannae]|uniref:hypothetical protein n=1 Tax=Occallatibacter savannae TaxID=1002691 RepID=UPI000D68BEF1|nr:hypothetical protein [Occallatibacter savannae]
MQTHLAAASALACVTALGLTVGLAAQSGKPLSNDDVIAMVNKKLPESVIVSAIKGSPGKYDTSPNELIRLNSAGLTENELNAMMSVSSKDGRSNETATGGTANPTSSRKWQMPTVTITQGSASAELKLEKTQLAQTKNKPTSMKSLASDSVLTQAMQAGVSTASWDAATHMNSMVAGSAVQQAGTVFSGMLAHRTPTVTYVWGVPGPASGNVLQTASPSFKVNFSRAPGVNPDDYEPAIVKLTPAQNTCRIVGATQAKADASASAAADWQVYSHYLEERVNTSSQKVASGIYTLFPSQMLPGEYGLVLRPISKEKKFSGGEVARAQGDGLIFDAIWTFQIADDAQ